MFKNVLLQFGQARRFTFTSAALAAASLGACLEGSATAQDVSSSSSLVADDPAPSATAQVMTGPPAPKHTGPERDISLGIFGQLTTTRRTDFSLSQPGSTGFNNSYEYVVGATASPGALLSYHQQWKPWLGFKVNLGYTRMREKSSLVTEYSYSNPPNNGTQFTQLIVRTDVIELSASYTFETAEKGQRLRWFGEVGGGSIAFNANHAQAEDPIAYRGLALAGAGLDWRLTNHLGLRAEYRGLLTGTPAWDFPVSGLFPTKRPTALISEPTVSLVYRFGGKKAAK